MYLPFTTLFTTFLVVSRAWSFSAAAITVAWPRSTAGWTLLSRSWSWSGSKLKFHTSSYKKQVPRLLLLASKVSVKLAHCIWSSIVLDVGVFRVLDRDRNSSEHLKKSSTRLNKITRRYIRFHQVAELHQQKMHQRIQRCSSELGDQHRPCPFQSFFLFEARGILPGRLFQSTIRSIVSPSIIIV